MCCSQRRFWEPEFREIDGTVGRAILGDPSWVTKIRTGDFAGLKDFAAETMGEWRTSVDPALNAVPGIVRMQRVISPARVADG